MKTCFKCYTEKPLTEFYKHPEMSDGRLNKCKDCSKKDVKENYRKNFKYYQEYEKLRNKSDKRRKLKTEYCKKYRKTNTQKYKAHCLLNNAIRYKKLIKPEKCSLCFSSGHIEGHHVNYLKPLEVEWVCSKCHKAIHKAERQAAFLGRNNARI